MSVPAFEALSTPWAPHPEVWVLVAGVVALAAYAVRVIGPKVVPAGEAVVTGRQKRWFVAGLVTLWLASDWPVHDIAEGRFYSVHMVQHTLLTLAAAPMFLLATPPWLARLVVGDGWFAGRALRFLCRPVVAGPIFNFVVIFLHWQNTVNASVANPALHYGLHVLAVAAALLMWTAVCGPLPELRMSIPGQMIYLFLMSIVPTVPAAWLTFADGVVYRAYAGLGVDAVQDQQIAGLVMKLGAGFYLWGIIIFLFFRWANRHMAVEKAGRTLTEREVLTWESVEAELAVAPPAPREHI